MKCNKKAVYRYTWPGSNESYCCEEHAQGIKNVANAIGTHQQFIPVNDESLKCQQTITSDTHQ